MKKLPIALALLAWPLAAATAEEPKRAEVVKWEYATITAGGTLTFESGGGETQAESWDNLAEKLKVSVPKGTSARLAVLNSLGDQGWELASDAVTLTTLANPNHFYTFKRRR